MVVGIDLLWVKPQKSGGIESYIRNLLNGFKLYSSDEFKFILFVSMDNHDTFNEYIDDAKFKKVICNVNSNKVVRRILWENLNLNRTGEKYNIDLMFVPVYSKPVYKSSEFPYLITIHDLQALHYPQYFSFIKNIWLKFAWKRCAKTADKIVAISNYVKDDIIKNLNINSEKIKVIYNPIILSDKITDFNVLKQKYNIIEKQYFYTVSSMLPHKNLKTLLYVIKKIKDDKLDLPQKLVISGVGGKSENELKELINDLNINENVIVTGFISNEDRDCLYKNAKVFLFPSVFEGFGMPPIEALMYGTPVVTTKCTSIPEVTMGLALYVENPYEVNGWIDKIKNVNYDNNVRFEFNEYNIKFISQQYISEFGSIINKL